MTSRRYYFLPLLAFLCIPLYCLSALATTAVLPADSDMVIGARAIITGKVINISTSLDAASDVVFTYVRLEVNDVLKGQILDREIVLRQPGGEVYDKGTLIYGMPRFEMGQEVLLYLDTWRDGALRVHQWFLGKFDISRDPSTGRLFVARQEEDHNVLLLANASAVSTNRSELEAYKEMIGRLVRTNFQTVQAFEQDHYSGVPVLAQPPEFDGIRHSGKVVPYWTNINPTEPIRWFEPDSNQPVVFYVNAEGAPNLQISNDIAAAMNAWSTVSSTSIRVVNGGSTAGCGMQTADNQNTISFNNCDGYFSASPGCAGLLGVAGIIRYTRTQSKVVGGTTYYKGVEANITINPYAACHFADRCNLQEVITHEMGHALGLGHSSDTNAMMYQYAHFDGRCASLGADDLTGISTMYPGSGGGGGSINITTASELPAASVDASYGVTLSATGGSGGYTWSVAGGQLPSGMQLSSSGFLYGTASAVGSFSFNAQVRDSSGNTSQKSFMLPVQPPRLSPVVTEAKYRKKKTTIYGDNFDSSSTVYIDGQSVSSTFDGTALKTNKKKLRSGTHTAYVINSDGNQSNTISFNVE